MRLVRSILAGAVIGFLFLPAAVQAKGNPRVNELEARVAELEARALDVEMDLDDLAAPQD